MRKSMYSHIPRTGGSSLEKAIIPYCTMFKFGDTLRPKPDLTADLIHFDHVDPIRALMRRCVPVEEFVDRFIFSFVRDPRDRLVSLYFYLRGYRLGQRRERESNRYLAGSFEGFARQVIKGNFVLPIGWNNVRDWSQANPQVRWLEHIKLDFLGRYENLDADWKRLCSNLGIEHHSMPRVRGTKHEPYTNYYSYHLWDAVTDFYWEDVQTYDYPKNMYS